MNINGAFMASSQNESAGSFADITELGMEVGANTTYIAQWALVLSSPSAGVGIQLELGGPASPTEVTAVFTSYASVGAPTVTNVNAYGAGLSPTTSPGGSTRVRANIVLTLRNGANGGTVFPRFRTSSAGTEVTLHAGSSLVYNMDD